MVLSGPGLFVNRAAGIGLDEAIDEQGFSLLEEASERVGVSAAIEVTPFADPRLREIARARGYERTTVRSVFSLALDAQLPPPPDVALDVVEVLDAAGLLQWQEIAAAAFGAESELARAAGDAYAATSHALETDRLLIGSDPAAGPVACCSLSVRDGIATLGGMGVVPSARGLGIQRAMIRARVDISRLLGADLAASSAVSNLSKRNLERSGFQHRYDQETWVRAEPDSARQ